jgi:hypothetical protein
MCLQVNEIIINTFIYSFYFALMSSLLHAFDSCQHPSRKHGMVSSFISGTEASLSRCDDK